MVEIKKIFGSLVKEARLLKGWSQTDLAQKLDLSQVAIHKIEKGHQRISLEMATQIAYILGLSLDQMVSERAKQSLKNRLRDENEEIVTKVESLLNRYSLET